MRISTISGHQVLAVVLLLTAVTLVAPSGTTNSIASITTSSDTESSESGGNLQKGLKTYYRFDEEVSESYSIEFDNSDDVVQVPDDKSLDLQSEFTLSVWAKPYSLSDGAFIRKDDAYTFYINGGTLDFYNWADSSRLSCSSDYIPENEWTHLSAVWNGTHKIIYADGERCNSQTSTEFPTTSNDLGIGGQGDGNAFIFDGAIESARIYNRSLSQSEILKLRSRKSVSSKDLVLHHEFDESPQECDLTSGKVCFTDRSDEGNNGIPQNFNDNKWNSGSGWSTASSEDPTTVKDHSSNNYNATLKGGNHGQLKNFAFNSTSGWTGGVRGRSALRFNEDDRVEGIDNTELVNAYNEDREITINLWFRIDDIHTSTRWNDMIQFGDNVDYDGSLSTNGVRLERNSNSNQSIAFYTRNEGGNNQYQLGSVDPYEVGKWHMATLVMDYKDRGESRTYLDGELVDTVSDPGDTWDMNRSTMEIFSAGHWADFSIDNLRFYGRDLSGSEIRSLYKGGKVREDLIGEWRFDRGEGNTTYGTSSVGKKGILNTDTVSFDGEDDYVEIKDFPSLESSLSVSAWIKSTAGDRYTNYWNAVSRYNQFILGPEGGEMSFIVDTPSDGWTYLDPPETPNKDQWHHFTGTWNASSGVVQLWRDGKLVKEREYTPENPQPETDPIHIGHRGSKTQGEDHLEAKIDEVRIYNRTLSKPEIRKLAFKR